MTWTLHGKLITLVLACGFVPLAAQDKPADPIDQLVAEAQKADDHQPELYGKVVRQEVDAAKVDYDSGKTEAAESALTAAATYSDKLLESARQHPKHLKRTEKGLRETARRLQQLERDLEFEQRPPAKAAREHLEIVDSELLNLELMGGHK